MLNSFDKNLIEGDLVEDRGNVVFVALFNPGKDENSTENACIIKRVRFWEDKQTGYQITEIKYANGSNTRFSCVWNERANYQYEYAKTK